jgi:hypothetical protein
VPFYAHAGGFNHSTRGHVARSEFCGKVIPTYMSILYLLTHSALLNIIFHQRVSISDTNGLRQNSRHHATTPPRLAHYLCKSVGPTVSSLLTLGTRQRSIYEVVSGGMAVCSTWKPGFRWGSASFPILAGSRASAGVGLVRPSRPPSVAPHKTRFALSASVYAV